MTFTERLMGTGDWSLPLASWTPGSVLSQISLKRFGRGHIVVTTTPVDVETLSDAQIMAQARYTGIYLRRPSLFELGGVHSGAWLGISDDFGDILGAATTEASFADWVTALRPTYLSAGTVSSIAGSFNQTFQFVTRRAALDEVCAFFGAEWAVRGFTLDVGTPADLFRAVPSTIITRRAGGRDPNVLGVMGDINLHADLDDWARTVLQRYADDTAVYSANGSVAAADVPFRGPTGQQAEVRKVVSASVDDLAEATGLGNAEFTQVRNGHQEVTLSSIEYDIGETVRVGDALWVWDEERDLYDPGNPVPYQGGIAYPEVIRCVGMTSPIRRGMGVYFRRFIDNGTSTWDVDWVDLTEYVAFEDGETTVEVGAKPRPLRGF